MGNGISITKKCMPGDNEKELYTYETGLVFFRVSDCRKSLFIVLLCYRNQGTRKRLFTLKFIYKQENVSYENSS